MGETRRIGLGLIGCGDFGLFCMDAFSQLEGVEAAAVADVRPEAVERFTQRYNIPGVATIEELVAHDGVDLVHVATPPSSHHELVLTALRGGKNVLCEKPLAMNTDQADEMVAEARKRDLICPVNFVMRYNPVADTVKAIIDSGVLGAPLSARLTNCASDHKLGIDHWFWKPDVAGGIFIEHGVHFFDLYSHWLGEASVLSSHTESRPDSGVEDRVMCTMRHESGAVSSHYHGFDQVLMMDRTDHRIVFELGDIRVDGWVPLSLEVNAATDQAGQERLQSLCPGADVQTVATYDGQDRHTVGRGREYEITRHIRLSYTPNPNKQAVYAESVRGLMADQVAYLRDGDHPRVVTEANGRAAVALAQAAREGAMQ
jgi:predicted dehydrogenase